MSALDGHRLARSEAVCEAAELLSKILAQDITDSAEADPGEDDSSEDGPSRSAPSETTDPGATDTEENGVEEGPQIRQGVATDRIISTVDPEMRHGRKSSSTRFDGYKVHISEAVESEFITGVAVTPGNQHDGAVAEDLADQVEERFGQAPSVLIGDSHYGSPDLRVTLREAFQEQDVEVVAKLPTATGGNGSHFDKTDFEIDLEEERVTCPAGQQTETSYQTRDHSGRPVQRFQFDGEVCAECPLRPGCTTAKNGRSITLHYHEDIVQQVRAYNETEEFEERYRKRPKVERKLSELLWTHGLRLGRYVGQKKTELQALLTAAVANLKRAGLEIIDMLLSAEQIAPEAG